MEITQRLVKSLKAPGQGNVIHYDGEIPGFGVRITAAGAISFVLNYRIGDRAAIVPGECPCGRNLPLLALEDGRVNAWITIEDERVHGMEILVLVKDDPDVRQFLVAQVGPARVEVTLVPRADVDLEAVRRRIEEGMQSRLGPKAEIYVEFADHIPPGPSGKRQVVISNSD